MGDFASYIDNITCGSLAYNNWNLQLLDAIDNQWSFDMLTIYIATTYEFQINWISTEPQFWEPSWVVERAHNSSIL